MSVIRFPTRVFRVFNGVRTDITKSYDGQQILAAAAAFRADGGTDPDEFFDTILPNGETGERGSIQSLWWSSDCGTVVGDWHRIEIDELEEEPADWKGIADY